jgi:hypothetical protein
MLFDDGRVCAAHRIRHVV